MNLIPLSTSLLDIEAINLITNASITIAADIFNKLLDGSLKTPALKLINATAPT